MTTTTKTDVAEFEAVQKLNRDLRNASKMLSQREVRYLVRNYYLMQEHRIRTGNQLHKLMVPTDEENEEAVPHAMLEYMNTQAQILEKQIAVSLDVYSENHPAGKWMRSQKGVGPIIAAGVLAHIDIKNTNVAGRLWSYAGLVPNVKWEKGQKRPWNAELKKLCAFKLGEAFVKVCNHDDAFYGKVYKLRKELEKRRNEAGEFKDQAAEILATKNFSDDTRAKAAYLAGRLPDAHIHARARRYAVKLFLSHTYEVWRTVENLPVVKPYPFTHMVGHTHFIPPPGMENLLSQPS